MIVINVIISLHYKEYRWHSNWNIKLGKFKSDQKKLHHVNQEILKASKKITTVGKLLVSWRGFAEGVLQVVLFTVLCFNWSAKKQCVARIFQCRFFSFFCLFVANKNKNQIFSKLVVSHSTSRVCQIQKFYKRVFLHIIQAHSIAPWLFNWLFLYTIVLLASSIFQFCHLHGS